MRQLLTSLGELAGAAAITVGCFHISAAVGWIAAGLLAIAASVANA